MLGLLKYFDLPSHYGKYRVNDEILTPYLTYERDNFAKLIYLYPLRDLEIC